MAITRKLQSLAEQRGYFAVVLSSDGNPELEMRAIETLRSLNVAGAIIAPIGEKSQHSALTRLAADVPIIYIDSPLDTTSPFVGTDNRKSFHLIVDYLCRSGSEPCYFSMPSVNSNAMTRQEAYRNAMEKLGYEPQIVEIEPAQNWDFEHYAFEQASRILREKGQFPTSTVLCANDRIAFGVMAAAWQAGLKIGRLTDCNIRIAGHDNNPLSEFSCPPLTTVAQDYNEISRLAMDLLFRTLGEPYDAKTLPEEPRILLSAEIKLRMSA